MPTMARRKIILGRKSLVALALVISVLLYLAGVYSGLQASRVIEERTGQDISFLVAYIDNLDSELRSLQIQEQFFNSLDETEACRFADTYFSEAASSLNYYWSIFPARLEDYEQGRTLTDEYLELKDEYTKLSIRAWLVARENYNKCDAKVVPVLYFYSTDCERCVRQGEILDDLKHTMQERNKTVVSFTIDIDSEEPAVKLITQFYNITEVPALAVNEQVLQGGVFTEERIMTLLKDGGR